MSFDQPLARRGGFQSDGIRSCPIKAAIDVPAFVRGIERAAAGKFGHWTIKAPPRRRKHYQLGVARDHALPLDASGRGPYLWMHPDEEM
jgi:hypothetical protein